MSGPGQMGGKPSRGEIPLGVRFVALAALCLVLIVVDHRENHLSRAREILSLAVYPIQVAVDFPFTAWQWATDTGSSSPSPRPICPWRRVGWQGVG